MPRKAKGPRVPKLRKNTNGQGFIEYKGKRYYLGKWDSDECHKRYAEAVAQILAGKMIGAKPIVTGLRPLLAELGIEYLEHTRTQIAEKEFTAQRYAVTYLVEFCGSIPGDEFGPRALETFRTYLCGKLDTRHKNKEAKPYSRRYVNQIVNRVKRFIRWCCRMERIPADQYSKLLAVEPLRIGAIGVREKPPVRPVNVEIIANTLPWMRPHIAAMVQLQHLCGMRPGEVCQMKTCDVLQTGQIWLYTVPVHKGTARGDILVKAIGSAAQAILGPLLRENPTEPIFSPLDSEQKRIGKKAGNRKRRRIRGQYDSHSYNQGIRYALDKAKRAKVEIPPWHAYQIRHTAGTAVSQLLGQQAAQRLLGHKNLNTTNIYTESQTKELIRIAQELDRHSREASALAQSEPVPPLASDDAKPHSETPQPPTKPGE